MYVRLKHNIFFSFGLFMIANKSEERGVLAAGLIPHIAPFFKVSNRVFYGTIFKQEIFGASKNFALRTIAP